MNCCCFNPRSIEVISNQAESGFLTYTEWVNTVNAALAADPDLRLLCVYSGSKGGSYDVAVLVK